MIQSLQTAHTKKHQTYFGFIGMVLTRALFVTKYTDGNSIWKSYLNVRDIVQWGASRRGLAGAFELQYSKTHRDEHSSMVRIFRSWRLILTRNTFAFRDHNSKFLRCGIEWWTKFVRRLRIENDRFSFWDKWSHFIWDTRALLVNAAHWAMGRLMERAGRSLWAVRLKDWIYRLVRRSHI